MQISRTHYADQAANTSDLINLKFSSLRFGARTKRVLRVREPDGPSTDGGRKARQSIVLATEEGGAGGAIVCGWIDVVARNAELKSYTIVAQAYFERYGVGLDLVKTEYQRAIEAFIGYLKELRIEVRMPVAPRRATTIIARELTAIRPLVQAPPPERVSKRDAAFAIAGFAAGLLVMYAFALLGAVG